MLHYNIPPEDKFLDFLLHTAISNKYKSCGLGPILVQQRRDEKQEHWILILSRTAARIF